MTETPLPVIFDPETLQAAGACSPAPGEHSTAHPHQDDGSGEALFYAVKFGPRSSYRLYGRRGSSAQRKIAGWGVRRPSYMHSFALTERYAVLAECPFTVDPLELIRSGRPFIENYRWHPDQPARFLVIDLHSGELCARAEAEPFFCFHHVNAFQEGDQLIVDLIAYEDAQIVESLYLEPLRAEGMVPRQELRRYRVPLGGGEARSEALATGLELPRINYRGFNARPYSYVYGTDFSPEDSAQRFVTGIKKVDVDKAESSEFSEPGAYPGEPVFVPAPQARREDDGVLLSLVLEPATETSYLLVLDAGDLAEIARARVPHPVPFGFHGQFYPAA